MIREYEALVEELITALSRANHPIAVELASLPEQIRGFGHVKVRNIAAVATERDALLGRFRAVARDTEHAA